jgi:hypothetical protein
MDIYTVLDKLSWWLQNGGGLVGVGGLLIMQERFAN